jgi:hypothetical protein
MSESVKSWTACAPKRRKIRERLVVPDRGSLILAASVIAGNLAPFIRSPPRRRWVGALGLNFDPGRLAYHALMQDAGLIR